MAKSAETESTKSSTISGKAVSMKKTIKRSAKAIARPFKKVKQSFSTRSATRSIASRLSMVLPPSDNEADNLNAKSVSDNGGTDPEVELTPEQELGLLLYLFHDVILINIF
jgi:hypothetical protein